MPSELKLRFSGNDQELNPLCFKESFSRIAKFYNIDGKILEAEQKMYASFRRVRELGYMTVSEMVEAMQENDLFDIFPEFSKVVHYITVFSRAIIQCVAPNENLPPQHHGATTCQQHCTY